jgi:hypothetical protein
MGLKGPSTVTTIITSKVPVSSGVPSILIVLKLTK